MAPALLMAMRLLLDILGSAVQAVVSPLPLAALLLAGVTSPGVMA